MKFERIHRLIRDMKGPLKDTRISEVDLEMPSQRPDAIRYNNVDLGMPIPSPEEIRHKNVGLGCQANAQML